MSGDEQLEKEEQNSMPTPEENEKRRKTVNLADFLIEEDADEKSEEEEENELFQFKAKTSNINNDSDVIKCGTMKKKTHSR